MQLHIQNRLKKYFVLKYFILTFTKQITTMRKKIFTEFTFVISIGMYFILRFLIGIIFKK